MSTVVSLPHLVHLFLAQSTGLHLTPPRLAREQSQAATVSVIIWRIFHGSSVEKDSGMIDPTNRPSTRMTVTVKAKARLPFRVELELDPEPSEELLGS